MNKKSAAGRALAQWRLDLIQDLGGDVSTQQAAVVDVALRTKLLLDSIDAWLLDRTTLVERHKVIAAVVQRQQIADSFARYMSMLGLHRRTKVTSLSEILAKDDKPEDGNGTADEGDDNANR